MIKILFICHGTTSVCESGVGCQLGKSVQIVALWKVPYYGFTTVRQMKNIYVQIPFFVGSRRRHAAMQVPFLE